MCQAECLLAVSLQQRALQNGPLALKQLRHDFAGQEAGAILQAVSPITLTSLSVEGDNNGDHPWGHHASLRNANLSAFSKLQSLQLCLTTSAAKSLIPAVHALVYLQYLNIYGIFSAEVATELVPQLPSSLQTLSLARDLHDDPISAQLQHLTALRSLDVGSLSDDSQLPQQLQQLYCARCSSMQPLLSCQQLQSLEINVCMAPAAEMCMLSSFALLARITLGVDSPITVDSLASGFRQESMKTGLQELSIRIFGTSLLPNTIKQLQWRFRAIVAADQIEPPSVVQVWLLGNPSTTRSKCAASDSPATTALVSVHAMFIKGRVGHLAGYDSSRLVAGQCVRAHRGDSRPTTVDRSDVGVHRSDSRGNGTSCKDGTTDIAEDIFPGKSSG
eukprot:GHUV01014697.1.p1 GENE.GHUV01014697.1~~GHUV01014697.1.p1  ORF type:complete len:389 (+),score=104.76 GHUV01014697.1:2027-3193(+)